MYPFIFRVNKRDCSTPLSRAKSSWFTFTDSKNSLREEWNFFIVKWNIGKNLTF